MSLKIPRAASPVAIDEHVVLERSITGIISGDSNGRPINDSFGSAGRTVFLGREQTVDPATGRAQILETKEGRRVRENLQREALRERF